MNTNARFYLKYIMYMCEPASFSPKKCDSCCHSTIDFSSKNKLSNVRSFNILLSGKGFKPPSILTVLKFLVEKSKMKLSRMVLLLFF